MPEDARAGTSPPEGAWIFLSHSHEDWRAVRDIRNLLEDKGHRPLMFFLKCMDDRSELHGLIRREIAARTWFLLCDSENARRSKWVQDEIALIRSMPEKYSEQVDLDEPLVGQLDRIDALCRRATVFLSYARDDTKRYAAALGEELVKNDYYLREPDFFARSDQDWQAAITESVDDALRHGFVLLLLSPDSARKEFVRFEVEYALAKAASIKRKGSVVPIVFGDARTTIAAFAPPARAMLETSQWFRFDDRDFHASAAQLVAELKQRIMG